MSERFVEATEESRNAAYYPLLKGKKGDSVVFR